MSDLIGFLPQQRVVEQADGGLVTAAMLAQWPLSENELMAIQVAAYAWVNDYVHGISRTVH